MRYNECGDGRCIGCGFLLLPGEPQDRPCGACDKEAAIKIWKVTGALILLVVSWTLTWWVGWR